MISLFICLLSIARFSKNYENLRDKAKVAPFWWTEMIDSARTTVKLAIGSRIRADRSYRQTTPYTMRKSKLPLQEQVSSALPIQTNHLVWTPWHTAFAKLRNSDYSCQALSSCAISAWSVWPLSVADNFLIQQIVSCSRRAKESTTYNFEMKIPAKSWCPKPRKVEIWNLKSEVWKGIDSK